MGGGCGRKGWCRLDTIVFQVVHQEEGLLGKGNKTEPSQLCENVPLRSGAHARRAPLPFQDGLFISVPSLPDSGRKSHEF